MPQLDIAFFVPQIFWLIVVFATLYIFMAGSAAPKIAGVLKKRQDAIAGDLVEAEKLQAKAESARVLYEKSQSEARSNVAAMVLSKREELKDIAEKEYLKLSKKLTAKADKAQMRIVFIRQISSKAWNISIGQIVGQIKFQILQARYRA